MDDQHVIYLAMMRNPIGLCFLTEDQSLKSFCIISSFGRLSPGKDRQRTDANVGSCLIAHDTCAVDTTMNFIFLLKAMFF